MKSVICFGNTRDASNVASFMWDTHDNCTVGFPSATTYTHLTEEMAQKAKANVETVQVKSEPVATLEVEDIFEDIKYVIFDEPHLCPRLSVGNATFSASLCITPKIDCGSPSVLIAPALCDDLGLHCHPLPSPSRYSQAFAEKTPII